MRQGKIDYKRSTLKETMKFAQHHHQGHLCNLIVVASLLLKEEPQRQVKSLIVILYKGCCTFKWQVCSKRTTKGIKQSNGKFRGEYFLGRYKCATYSQSSGEKTELDFEVDPG